MIIAAVLYIVGVIGIELLGGRIDEQVGRHNPTYVVYSTIEEVLEMGGLVVFIYALMSYISTEFEDLRFRISS